MKLGDLIAHLSASRWQGDADVEISAVSRDSREVGAQTLFVAIEGAKVDGHRFVASLNEVGAVVVQKSVDVRPGVPWVQVDDTRRALALASAAVAGFPSRKVPVVGVTGTNGKTTVTTLLQQIVEGTGLVAGRIGTTGVEVGGVALPAKLTTPEAPVLQGWIRRMHEAGARLVAMEVSSIGLDQQRVDGIGFELAVFTQLGRDHLDFHGTMEAYAASKSRLFRELLREPAGMPRALLFGDEPAWRQMDPPADRWLYGFDEDNDVQITSWVRTAHGMRLMLRHPLGTHELEVPLLGRHNALNVTAAFASGLLLGLDADAMAAAVPGLKGAPGRLEVVPNPHGLTVVVDYAHTPDALSAVVAAVRPVVDGEVWLVFGCGGDRDRAKRSEMGRAALAADRVCVTSDNPRSEDPMAIIAEVLEGAGSGVMVEPERGRAIASVIAQAKPGDAVVIAGKGHETTQEIAGRLLPFDDRLVARDALEAR